ncbi:hypothetical protein [Leptolyngbya ohadii]|uniref:hypothetical protein n=1 Tax=Leptolyngbya ohadii TaxID=1962290 RepID=UPI0015C5AC44|nr:hypothetical protein [Leptolyngbya ohadii]
MNPAAKVPVRKAKREKQNEKAKRVGFSRQHITVSPTPPMAIQLIDDSADHSADWNGLS